MPRLRRRAREKRAKPRLDRGVWEWLRAGQPDPRTLPVSTQWDLFVLEGPPIQWRRNDDDSVEIFWELVERAVKAGNVEIADRILHNFFDKPLIDEPDWQTFFNKNSKRRVHANATVHETEQA